MELDALGCERKMCRVLKSVKTSYLWRLKIFLSAQCSPVGMAWHSLGHIWAAGCLGGKFHISWAWGVFQMLVACPDLAHSRGIWLAVPLILWTRCAGADGALPWSTNSIILCSVLRASPFPSFCFCHRVWRPVPRQTSGGRGLYLKIIYCRIQGALVQGGTPPN